MLNALSEESTTRVNFYGWRRRGKIVNGTNFVEVKTNTNKRHRNVVATTSFHAQGRASETFRVRGMFLTVLFPPKKGSPDPEMNMTVEKTSPQTYWHKKSWMNTRSASETYSARLHILELVLKRAMENLGQNWFHENLHTLRLRGRTNFQVALLKLGNSTTQCRLP